jgi:proline iminopeptidase
MPQVKANGINIEYDCFGNPGHPVVLLIMGLGTQMIAWSESFCERIAAAGFRVIRFDNRDCGLSQKMDKAPTPGVLSGLLRSLFGWRLRKVAYTLDDMADDAAGLLDALQISAAHVVGASMGGMIAQVMAVRHASRVLSLVSLMSATGAREMQKPDLRRLWPLLTRRSPGRNSSREERVEYTLFVMSLIGNSNDSPAEEARLRDLIERSSRRSIDFHGLRRQSAAIAASGNRRELLRRISAPTLVIHGKDDPLLPALAGFDTIMHVRAAKAEFIDDMAHDLPESLYERIADSIVTHCTAANRQEKEVA